MIKDSFVHRYGIWDDARRDAAEAILRRIKDDGINTVRISFADQHGVLRGKTIVSDSFEQVLYNGCGITTTLLLKDISHHTAFPVWQSGGGFNKQELTGASDFLLIPDPLTFRTLPWVEGTGWILCDCYFSGGEAVPFSSRRLLQNTLADLSRAGYRYLSGMELEFSIYKVNDPKLRHEDCSQPATPPIVSPLTHGFQYLTETRYDEMEPILDKLRDMLVALGLPLRTLEAEFGPSQVELTFHTVSGCEGADNAVLARSAIRQVCRRYGYHASFMCRPALPNAFSSGWHLHQSLLENETGRNAFVPETGELLSAMGQQYLAGLLAHAREACAFSTPTINGYKRYRPFTLAPNHIVWGMDNRGTMLRLVGTTADGTLHLENRVGEPAANPYLYFASQIICGLDGINNELIPPEPVDTPYAENWEKLPRNLYEAITHLKSSKLFRDRFGDIFVDYFVVLKEFELNRFLSEEVTDWEQREYFANL